MKILKMQNRKSKGKFYYAELVCQYGWWLFLWQEVVPVFRPSNSVFWRHLSNGEYVWGSGAEECELALEANECLLRETETLAKD